MSQDLDLVVEKSGFLGYEVSIPCGWFVKSLWPLTQNMRVDDAKCIMDAIRQLRGVACVQANVADLNSHIAQEQAKWDLRNKMRDLLVPGS